MSPALNNEQRAAMEALSGPVIISAGAGSGKTRTLCERFVRATTSVGEESWEAAGVDEVLAITFTDKAAGEIAERIRGTLRASGRRADALAVDGAWISTIHGLCSRLLRRHALEAGVDPVFSIADDVETQRLRAEAFEAAAAEVLESDEGRVLFESCSFGGVHAAVTAAALHSMVLSAGRTSFAEPRETRPAVEVLEEAIALFGQAAGQVAACASPTQTAEQLERCCECAAEALAAIEPENTPDPEIARALVEALGEWKPGRRVKALADVQARLSEGQQRLSLEAIELLDAWHELALLRLTHAFADRLTTLKRERGVLDFDDLQTSVAALFDTRPDVLARCRSGFRLSMVDEFQDTDALQLSLIERLARPNLCTVGDERQAIYGFRGADIDVYRAHIDGMREVGARDFTLDTNYRSHPAVLAVINSLFASDRLFGRAYRPLRAGRTVQGGERGPDVRVSIAAGDTSSCRRGESRTQEAAWVADRFAALRSDYSPGEMVVLVRGYTHAETYARALRQVGLEAAIVGGSRLFERPETHMVRALVRVIGNPHDEEGLVDLLAGDVGRITDDGLFKLGQMREGDVPARGLWDALKRGGDRLSDIDAMRADRFVRAVEEARERLGWRPLADLVLQALERLDVDTLLLSRGAEGRQAFANVLMLCRRIASLEERGIVGPAAVEDHLAAMHAYGTTATPAALAAEDTPVVRIMSVHASKGLEFPVVAAVELDAYVQSSSPEIDVGRVPEDFSAIGFAVRPPAAHKAVRESTRYGRMRQRALAAEAQEATRLFYVACTRAEDVLLLSGGAKLSMPVDPSDPQPLSALRAVLSGIDRATPGEGPSVTPAGDGFVEFEVLVGSEGDEPAAPDGGRPPAADRGDEPMATWVESAHSGALTRPPSAPVRVSYTDFAVHERCALRFHAERVLRLGHVSSGPSAAADLGSAVHAALQLNSTRGGPGEDRLEAIARSHRLDVDARLRFTEAVERFATSRVARRLEATGSVRREWPFVVRMGSDVDGFELSGSLDAYARSGDEGYVVDYKTGLTPSDAQIESRYELQATCYAAAAAMDGCRSVRVEFVRLELPEADGESQTVAFDFDEVGLARALAEVRRRYAGVTSDDRRPLDRWDQSICGDCPAARTVCPVAGPPERTL